MDAFVTRSRVHYLRLPWHISYWTMFTLGLMLLMFTVLSSSPSSPGVALAYHSLPAVSSNENNQLCNDIHCLHGTCHQGKCVCDLGWYGKLCHMCGGRVRLTQSFGYISDGRKNYTTDQQCTWLIDASYISNKSIIRLKFIEFETECSWDHLYIFKGDSVFAPLVGAFSGTLLRRNPLGAELPEVEVNSPQAYVYFYSDTAYFMSGFNLSYQIIPCEGDSCDATNTNRKSEYGNLYESGQCELTPSLFRNDTNCNCNDGLDSIRCHHQICPNKCSMHGDCNREQRRCICKEGFAGSDCGQIKLEGYWEPLHQLKIQRILGRALHQSEIVQDQLYIVGGEFFEKSLASEQFLMRFSFEEQKWTNLSHPMHENLKRFGHSLQVTPDQRKLVMFGGMLENGTISNDMWNYDILSHDWQVILPKISAKLNCQNDFCAPLAVVGHTANVVEKHMYVFFGYSPRFGYLNSVQQYNFDTKEWSILQPAGALVKGGFGHSSVYHTQTAMIYVYGGHHSAWSDSVLVDSLYGYSPSNNKWTLLTPSQSARYFHSAAIVNDQMYVYGGNAHNATNDHIGSQCFSTQFMVYNIACDSWHFLSEPSDVILSSIGTGRFGHVGFAYRNEMYIFGGFNGIMLNSMLRYRPGNCSMVNQKLDCLKMRFSLNCVWNEERKECKETNFFSSHEEEDRALNIISNPSSDAIAVNATSSNMKSKCPTKHVNYNKLCEKLTNCPSCLENSYGCVWCDDSCQHEKCKKSIKRVLRSSNRCDSDDPSTLTFQCDKFHNCFACHTDKHCTWQTDQKCHPFVHRFGNKTQKAVTSDNLRPYCDQLCHLQTSCGNCTAQSCMWCSSLGRCVESNAYAALFPLAQCMEWTIHSNKCNNLSCQQIDSCEKCQANPRCGWCDDGKGTGVGKCMEGTNKGAYQGSNELALRNSENQGNRLTSDFLNKLLNSFNKPDPERVSSSELNKYSKNWFDSHSEVNKCTAKRWHFTDCPICQCNGHSKCKGNSSVCEEPCSDLTTGPHCEQCLSGYYGNPVNGGTCAPCECNQHSDRCNTSTGRCTCNTKGVIGHHCEKCDEHNHYFGNPVRTTCFYNLSIDFQYTFNMSKFEDRYYKRINFMNTPPKPDVDVDFTISCSVPAIFNISFGSSTMPIRQLHENHLCTNTRFRFSHDEQLFGVENTSFYVHVADYNFPILLQISFSQHRTLDLLQFFVTFSSILYRFFVAVSSCFLTLLVIAAVLWKVKQKYDMYRRRQQLFMELEHLASRPFSAIIVHLPETQKQQIANTLEGDSLRNIKSSKSVTSSKFATSSVDTNLPLAVGGDMVDVNSPSADMIIDPESEMQSFRNSLVVDNPTPISLELCHGNRAAVLSLIVRLPTGGTGEVPIGQTGVAIASALVSLGPCVNKKTSHKHVESDNRKSSPQALNVQNAPVFL